MGEMKIKDVWVVMSNTDLTEGRGREFIKHYCETQSTAIRLGRKGYVQGTHCPVRKRTLVWLYNTWYGPVRIEPAQAGDIKRDEDIQRVRDVHAKALELGMSTDEIELLSSGSNDHG